MADWRRNKRKKQDNVEDFILFQEEPKAEEGADSAPAAQEETPWWAAPAAPEEQPQAGQEEVPAAPEAAEPEPVDAEDTGILPMAQEEPETAGEKTILAKVQVLRRFCAAHKPALIGTGIALGALAVVIGLIAALTVFLNPLRGYTQVAVVKGNVIDSMNTSGTMSANARYSITSLVSGAIVESGPQVGDQVEEGEVLYMLDDTEAKLAVERARNMVERAKAVGASAASAISRIYATDAGNIQSLNIQTGSTVSAGQIVATIERQDKTVVSLLSTVTGTVSAVNVARGRSVTAGTLIATVKDSAAEASQRTSSYDQKSSELDLEAAQKQLENYTITSPVSGIIVEKNAKVGDNVSMTNTEHPMMVIVDMNSMKFTFQADASTVWMIEPGQSVIVTAPSIPNETFSGTVSRVASEGVQDDQGEVWFDVDVTIEEPGDLKAGMQVDARVILASATNALYLPEQALMEADGENALVLIQEEGSSVIQKLEEDPDAPVIDGATEEELAFPWIEVPKGCRLITVQYGISDGTNVEIVSGLEEGDIVVYDSERESGQLTAATSTPATSLPSGQSSGDSPTPSATVNPEDMTEEEARQQLLERVQNLDL